MLRGLTVLSALRNAFSTNQVRAASAIRTPVTDVAPLREKLDPTQINIPVVVRRHPVGLHQKNSKPNRLRARHFKYDLVSLGPPQKFPDVEVILTKPNKYGVVGTKVAVSGLKAYRDLILPGLAVYASPENIEKYGDLITASKNQAVMSTTEERTVDILSRMMVSITMNMNTPWTIEKWHVRVSLRKCGIVVPDQCIELPEKPITGPDLGKQGKHFISTLTINKKYRVPVRCCINHWSNDPSNIPPWKAYWWLDEISPVFEEDRSRFPSLPPVRGPYPSASEEEQREED